jgi:hypothetical protein
MTSSIAAPRRPWGLWVFAGGLLLTAVVGTAAAAAVVLDGAPSDAIRSVAGTHSVTGSDRVTPAAGDGPTGTTRTTGTTDRTTTSGAADDGADDADDAIKATWDGPAVQLDWQGQSYATAEASFVGDRTISPGDQIVRTLDVQNAGPRSAVMSIALEASGTGATTAADQALAQHVQLVWNVDGVRGSAPFSVLTDDRGTPHVVSEIRVPRGRVAPVEVGVRMDRTTTVGHQATGALAFDVVVRLQGSPSADKPEPDHHVLAFTGLGGLALPLAILGAVLVLLGLALLASRRPVCDICRRSLERHERVVWWFGRDRHHTCRECYTRLGEPGRDHQPGAQAMALSEVSGWWR